METLFAIAILSEKKNRFYRKAVISRVKRSTINQLTFVSEKNYICMKTNAFQREYIRKAVFHTSENATFLLLLGRKKCVYRKRKKGRGGG